MQQVEEQLTVVTTIVNKAAEFMVQYSFQILGALIILAVGMKLGQLAAKFVRNFGQKRQLDITLTGFMASVARLSVIVFAVVIALGNFGVTIAPLVAALGALAFGGSLAIQGPISNYGAGLSLLLSRPFKVGDTILVTGVSGQVEDIKLACTVLISEAGERITIPNKSIVGEIMVNSYAYRLATFEVGVGYQDDPDAAIRTVAQAVAGNAQVAREPKPVVGLHRLGESSIDIGIRFWIPTRNYYETAYAVHRDIFYALKEKGFSSPVPQREVRLIQEKA